MPDTIVMPYSYTMIYSLLKFAICMIKKKKKKKKNLKVEFGRQIAPRRLLQIFLANSCKESMIFNRLQLYIIWVCKCVRY